MRSSHFRIHISRPVFSLLIYLYLFVVVVVIKLFSLFLSFFLTSFWFENELNTPKKG